MFIVFCPLRGGQRNKGLLPWRQDKRATSKMDKNRAEILIKPGTHPIHLRQLKHFFTSLIPNPPPWERATEAVWKGQFFSFPDHFGPLPA
jgi:hypothetical protein